MSVFSPKRWRKQRSIVKLNMLYLWSRIFLRALNGRTLAHIIRMRSIKIFDATLLICNVYTRFIQNPMNLYTRCVQCTHTPYAKILTVSNRKFDRLYHRPASSSSSWFQCALNFKKFAGNGTAFCLNDIWFALAIRQKAVLLPANGFKIEEQIENFCSAPANKNQKKSGSHWHALDRNS